MIRRAISAWPDPSVLFRALGAEVVKQKADAGDRAAQYSLGCNLLNEAEGVAGAGLGAAGRSTQVKVGLAHKCTFRSFT